MYQLMLRSVCVSTSVWHIQKASDAEQLKCAVPAVTWGMALPGLTSGLA